MKIIVNHDYLLKLAKNELTDQEILKGYFEYYFCQGRNIGDLKQDYFTACSPAINKNSDYVLFQSVTPEQIKSSLQKLEEILNQFLKNNFDLVIQESMFL